MSSRVFTIPNVLSMIRLVLVPVFFVLVVVRQDVLALLVVVVSTVTDYLDGVIARRFRQISRLGQLLDPAADRLFILAAILALAVREVVPWWMVAVLLGRDLMLLVLGVVLAQHGHGPLPVHHLGKAATLFLFYAFPILVLAQAVPWTAPVADPIGWAFGLWGAFLYWWAGILYVVQAARLLREEGGAAGAASDTLNR